METIKIAIVDDHRMLSGAIEKMISINKKYQVINTSGNGEDFINAIENDKINPDVVLMDVNMPEMDGFAATRALRGDKDTKHIPVILVTAKDQKADKAWGQMLGAKGYVTKPFTDEQLLEQIRQL